MRVTAVLEPVKARLPDGAVIGTCPAADGVRLIVAPRTVARVGADGVATGAAPSMVGRVDGGVMTAATVVEVDGLLVVDAPGRVVVVVGAVVVVVGCCGGWTVVIVVVGWWGRVVVVVPWWGRVVVVVPWWGRVVVVVDVGPDGGRVVLVVVELVVVDVVDVVVVDVVDVVDVVVVVVGGMTKSPTLNGTVCAPALTTVGVAPLAYD